MDISRMADISSISRTTLTHSAEHRTQEKSSTLAADHTDAFIKSEAAFTPAYTKRSAQKQPSDNNLTQRENSEDKVGAVKQNDGEGRAELLTQGVQHIIRAMLVKQGEVLTGNVPSVGAKLYANVITIDQFAEVKLRSGEITACEKIKKAKKLLKLTVDDGRNGRQIVSGIANWYQPEDLIGRKIVFVANLAPAKLCGELSEGMILACDAGDNDVRVLFLDKDVPNGSTIR